MTADDEKFMKLALEKAREGIDNGQSPFGACIVKDGKVIACEHNMVLQSADITAHAEIVALRNACRNLNDIDLSGSIIYSTCEPCPMCFTAIHWARISKIIYGAGIEDAKRFGFNELVISNEMLKQHGNSSVEIEGAFMQKECAELFEYWASKTDKRTY